MLPRAPSGELARHGMLLPRYHNQRLQRVPSSSRLYPQWNGRIGYSDGATALVRHTTGQPYGASTRTFAQRAEALPMWQPTNVDRGTGCAARFRTFRQPSVMSRLPQQQAAFGRDRASSASILGGMTSSPAAASTPGGAWPGARGAHEGSPAPRVETGIHDGCGDGEWPRALSISASSRALSPSLIVEPPPPRPSTATSRMSTMPLSPLRWKNAF